MDCVVEGLHLRADCIVQIMSVNWSFVQIILENAMGCTDYDHKRTTCTDYVHKRTTCTNVCILDSDPGICYNIKLIAQCHSTVKHAITCSVIHDWWVWRGYCCLCAWQETLRLMAVHSSTQRLSHNRGPLDHAYTHCITSRHLRYGSLKVPFIRTYAIHHTLPRTKPLE